MTTPEEISPVEGQNGRVPGAPHQGAVGRNAPCPCGSGKKYKRCCLGTSPARAVVPARPPSVYALANQFMDRGEFAQAIPCYECVVQHRPFDTAVRNNLALALQKVGRVDEAVAHYQQAVRLEPRHPDFLSNLGTALRDAGRLEEALAALAAALAALEEAATVDPRRSETYILLGEVLGDLERYDEGFEALREAARLNPKNKELAVILLLQAMHHAAWTGIEALTARVTRDVRQGGTRRAFLALTLDLTPAEQGRCLRSARASRLPLGPSGARQPRTPTPRQHLRLGYLSPDLLHQHATSHLIAEVFELRDRSRYEVTVYAHGKDDGGALAARIRSASDRIVDVSTLSDEEAAQLIARDECDILVDLGGHLHDARPAILARHPAPVQVSYLVTPGTSGADFMDYIIVDPFVVPAGHESFYTERLVYLPECYQPNDRQRPISVHVPTREACGLPAQGVVFCDFNQVYKTTPALFEVWCRLLHGTPGSVLWLFDGENIAAGNLRREAAARGVDPARLVIAAHVDPAEHLARLRLADLFVDTYPVTAHTTCSDALWAGLPLVTCAGETFVSRVAGSLLHAAGLPELVTSSLEEYEAMALRLATHPDELARYRARLAATRDTCPLFDTPRYVRHLERAFELMWEATLAGDTSRAPLVVPALSAASAWTERDARTRRDHTPSPSDGAQPYLVLQEEP